ncbi:MAG: hypothetical protein LBM41_08425 [Ruminococcus sp.]|jgi:hypothetical protein|nr:hypothetical protein [Ruminococcus sp.]
MKLRSFLYLDTKILNDYISAMDGYVYDAETRTENYTKQNTANAKAGIAIAAVGGQLGEKSTEEVKKEVRISDAAKFDRVLTYLEEDNNIYYELLTSDIFSSLHRDDFLEVLVLPRFSKMKELVNTAKNLEELAEVFQSFSEKTMIDKKAQDVLNGMKKFDEYNSKKDITCVFNFIDKTFPIIASLDKRYFKVDQEQFVGQVNLLCKIQQKIEKGNNIELDEIFETVKNLPLNRNQKRNMPKNMTNPQIIRDIVKGPALKVIPIAVYL